MVKVYDIKWDDNGAISNWTPREVRINLNYFDPEDITQYLENRFFCKVLDYKYRVISKKKKSRGG